MKKLWLKIFARKLFQAQAQMLKFWRYSGISASYFITSAILGPDHVQLTKVN